MHDYVILDSHVTRQEENDGEGRGSEILKSLEMEAGGVAYKRKKASEKERKEERKTGGGKCYDGIWKRSKEMSVATVAGSRYNNNVSLCNGSSY